jgi:hypothetical protein
MRQRFLALCFWQREGLCSVGKWGRLVGWDLRKWGERWWLVSGRGKWAALVLFL